MIRGSLFQQTEVYLGKNVPNNLDNMPINNSFDVSMTLSASNQMKKKAKISNDVAAIAKIRSRYDHWIQQDIVFMTSLETSDIAQIDSVYQHRVNALMKVITKASYSRYWAPVL